MTAFLLLTIAALAIALVKVLRQERSSRALLDEVIESVTGGFVLWDSHDRLVTCNQAFRDIYPLCDGALVPGTPFEVVVEHGVLQGQYPQADGREAAFIREMVDAHQRGEQTAERQLRDGRWLLIHERRTRSGNIIAIRSDITALKRALAEAAAARDVVEHMAHHDMLTGLPNRMLFEARLAASLASPEQEDDELAVLYLDLDRFKQVNDELGHGVGDELLAAVAGRLKAEVGEAGLAARVGGDEFAILITGSNLEARAEELARRIAAAAAAPYALTSGTGDVGVSVGVALCTTPDVTAEEIVRRADMALYRAKRSGRGTVCFDGRPSPASLAA
jgi:diguanylate cyclase (GGDEF)-like protein